MNLTKICCLGVAAGQLLLWQNALANDHARLPRASVHWIGSAWKITVPASTHRSPAAPASASRGRKGRGLAHDLSSADDDYKTGYVAGLRDGLRSPGKALRSRAGIPQRNRYAQATEAYFMREHADRDARAERIYRSSQLSAPIIIDAKACKRIGSRGESIYENCQLAGTCNARAGVATCQPSG